MGSLSVFTIPYSISETFVLELVDMFALNFLEIPGVKPIYAMYYKVERKVGFNIFSVLG